MSNSHRFNNYNGNASYQLITESHCGVDESALISVWPDHISSYAKTGYHRHWAASSEEYRYDVKLVHWWSRSRCKRYPRTPAETDYRANQISNFVADNLISLFENHWCGKRSNKWSEWNCRDIFDVRSFSERSYDINTWSICRWSRNVGSLIQPQWHVNQRRCHEESRENVEQGVLIEKRRFEKVFPRDNSNIRICCFNHFIVIVELCGCWCWGFICRLISYQRFCVVWLWKWLVSLIYCQASAIFVVR